MLLPLLALALSASIIFTAEGATRYRAPFDPLIAMLACFAAVTLLDALRARRADGKPAPTDRSVPQTVT